MQKFLEELSKASGMYDEIPTDTDADHKFNQMKDSYTKCIGCRALYTDKVEKESRVITIMQATDRYIVVKYNYYGMGYSGCTTACISYSAILCGDARVEIE